MKRIWFVSFGLLLAAVLAGCSGQVDSAAPAATAIPAPAAAPIESSASPTETPAPALSPAAEIGVEYEDLSFLSDDPRQVYELAYKLRYALYGIPDNLVGMDVTPKFTHQVDDDKVFVRSVGNYLLYENPYSDFTDLIQRVFTADFIKSLGPLYTEKFVDLGGHLATSTDDTLLCPMMDDLSRTVMDNCPDTYRLESATDDTVIFALISHYDRNWNTSFTPEDMDVYTIEYPIRLVRTADGWRVDEFHCTDFGYGEALFEPPLTEQDAQIPTPDFLTEEHKQLYLRAYKMMLVRAGTYIIDDTQYFSCDTPDTTRTQADTVTLDGCDYTPALHRYRNWDFFYATLRDIFTKDFLADTYLSSDGFCYFRSVDGDMYYLLTERGMAAGYDPATTTMTFTKQEETDEKIVIGVTAVYATDDSGSQAFRQAVQDELISDTTSYTITLVREVGGWRFASFDVPY